MIQKRKERERRSTNHRIAQPARRAWRHRRNSRALWRKPWPILWRLGFLVIGKSGLRWAKSRQFWVVFVIVAEGVKWEEAVWENLERECHCRSEKAEGGWNVQCLPVFVSYFIFLAIYHILSFLTFSTRSLLCSIYFSLFFSTTFFPCIKLIT